jgi:hypothetical protein
MADSIGRLAWSSASTHSPADAVDRCVRTGAISCRQLTCLRNLDLPNESRPGGRLSEISHRYYLLVTERESCRRLFHPDSSTWPSTV